MMKNGYDEVDYLELGIHDGFFGKPCLNDSAGYRGGWQFGRQLRERTKQAEPNRGSCQVCALIEPLLVENPTREWADTLVHLRAALLP